MIRPDLMPLMTWGEVSKPTIGAFTPAASSACTALRCGGPPKGTIALTSLLAVSQACILSSAGASSPEVRRYVHLTPFVLITDSTPPPRWIAYCCDGSSAGQST